MADAAPAVTRRVQVANLAPGDAGRGVARLPVKLMTEMGLAEGDVIAIAGKRQTAARAIRPYGDDEGLDIIRLDGLQRANAGVGSGDFVEVKKAVSKPATRVAGFDSVLRTSTKSPDPTPALARWSPSRRRMSSPSSSP